MSDLSASGVELPDLDLLKKFDIPAPRYTSYPTADRFTSALTAEDYEEALRNRENEKNKRALSVYVHIPFCNDVCYYCGCNKIVTRDHDRATGYLDVIAKEADLVKQHLTGDTEIEQLHFGGGTPTFLTNEELERVMSIIRTRFPLQKGGEFSIEVDPRCCPKDKVEKLAELGLNRMSLGVQDLNPDVQKAVNRIQPYELVRDTVNNARAAGFHSVNMDLIYGLPKQTRESFAETIDKVIEMSPDRIALYHYAHLPNHFKPQRMILNADLPSTLTKVEIMFDAIRRLTANGYRYIGMDHFAKETIRFPSLRRTARCSGTSRAIQPALTATWWRSAPLPFRRSAGFMPATRAISNRTMTRSTKAASRRSAASASLMRMSSVTGSSCGSCASSSS